MENKMADSDLVSMFRNAFYSAMGVRNDESKPTDRQILQWFNRVIAQAEHVTDPPLTLVPHEPISVKCQGIVPVIQILRWDVKIYLPDWRDLREVPNAD